MDEDLRRGLLTKKIGFEKMYEDGLMRVAKMRQKNDGFQRNIGPDIDEELRQEINEQSDYIQKEIKQLRDLIDNMEAKYRDPESRNKIKQLKVDAHKQIQRNKFILKDVITNNYLKKSKGSSSKGSRGKQNDDSNKYIQGGVVNYQHLNGHNSNSNAFKKDSVMTDPYEQQNQIQIDYDGQRKMMLEKNELINEVEQKTQRINDIINDMGIEVEEQGQNLDVISDELMNTNKNLVQTNEQMDEAIVLQKKARRKYVFLVVLILVILAGVGGVIYFLTQ